MKSVDPYSWFGGFLYPTNIEYVVQSRIISKQPILLGIWSTVPPSNDDICGAEKIKQMVDRLQWITSMQAGQFPILPRTGQTCQGLVNYCHSSECFVILTPRGLHGYRSQLSACVPSVVVWGSIWIPSFCLLELAGNIVLRRTFIKSIWYT